MKKLGIFVFGLIAVVACSHDDGDGHTHPSGTSSGYTDHSSPYPACDEIIKACHPLDVGEGTIHDCHDQGHGAKSEADCLPVKEMCLATCKAAAAAKDAGTSADSGADASPTQ